MLNYISISESEFSRSLRKEKWKQGGCEETMAQIQAKCYGSTHFKAYTGER